MTENNIECGGWSVKYTNEKMFLPETAANEGKEILKKWAEVFPRENTWVQRNFKVPSILVRFDHFVNEAGQILVCEAEEEPAGTGFATIINSQFRNNIESLIKEWPPFNLLIAPNWSGNDDRLWLNEIRLDQWKPPQLVWIKSFPCDPLFHPLEKYSVTSLTKKWDKSYGEKLGLWKKVSYENIDSLPWETGFVLKPLIGCRSKDVEIWDPKKRTGYSTKSRIKRTFQKENTMYVQEFISPNITKFGHTLFRTSYGFRPSTSEWECLGGVWIARNNIRLHGSPDSIWGPLVLGKK